MANRSFVKQLASQGIAAPLPSARATFLQRRHPQHAPLAAVETAAPAAVDDAPREEKPAKSSVLVSSETSDGKNKKPRRRDQRREGKSSADGKDGRDNSSQQPEALDRALIKERSRLLLNGEAVGLTMKSTPEDLAAGFKGLRPLAKELRRQNHTLLFFPSTRIAKPEHSGSRPAESLDDAQQPQQEQRQKQQQKQQQGKTTQPRVLDLALVAVPYFQKPEPEVTIRVGAKSKPDVIARTVTRALLRSSSVAVRAAGPSAAHVALQAAAQARRGIGAEQQLDLAFSIEYLRLPATEVKKPPSDVDQAATDATAAAEPEPVAAAVTEPAVAPLDGSVVAAATATTPITTSTPAAAAAAAPSTEGPVPMTSVLQFTFYKRALPTPEVLVSDFASTRSGPAMAQLLISLVSERREVDVLLESRDALFAMQTLARVVRDSWVQKKASVGVYLTNLEYQTDESSGTDGAAVADNSSNNVHFTARMQLRRIAGAPNLVSAGARQSLLGAPAGTVKWDSPIGGLAGAMGREWYSAGLFSVWPQEGVCVARVLRALWKAQQERAAAAAANTDAVAAPPSSPVFQIALIPELQEEGSGSLELKKQRSGRDAEAAADDASGMESREGDRDRAVSRQGVPRATILHLLEVSPLLASTLRSKDGRVVPISGGEQLHQLIKAVILRNRMYGNRPGGKLLTLRPLLDEGGALAMRFQYIDHSVVAEIPSPPSMSRDSPSGGMRSRQQMPPPPPLPVDDGYATDDEFGVGAEAAVLVPVAAAGAAAAAAATGAGGKAPWIMFVTSKTASMKLAMSIVAETCKPYDRMCPTWLRVRVLPDTIATAALSVAMAQAQVQERGNVELLVVPTLERKRDEQNRPFNALTWKLIKYGPGAEPGAAAAAAAAVSQPKAGPSAAAMAAAAAAAAKVQARDNSLLGGTRRLW